MLSSLIKLIKGSAFHLRYIIWVIVRNDQVDFSSSEKIITLEGILKQAIKWNMW